jgi:MFS family permease
VSSPSAHENASPGSGIFGPERRRSTIGILLAVTLFAVEGMGVVPALPVAVRELGGLPFFGWSFSAFMLAWLVGTVAGGSLADARGPRLPMALGLAGFGGGLLVASAAHRMPELLAGRALQGAGGGGVMASAYVAIARGYPDAIRARMLAITASAWVLPAVVGPAISGAVAERLGWRFVFAGVVPLVVVAAIVALPPLAALSVRRPSTGRTRVGWALAVAAGGALVIASPSLVTRSPLVAGAALGIGVLVSAPALRALLPRGTFGARPGLPAGVAARALLAFAFFGTEAFVPLASTELRGASPTQAGLALTAGAMGWISASWALDRVESRSGARLRVAAVRGGFMLVAIGIAVVAAVLLSSAPLPLLLVGWCVSGAGIGLAYAAGTLLCIAAAPEGQEGEVSGQLQIAEALSNAAGAGLGSALLAALTAAGSVPRHAHAAVFAVTLAAALAGFLVSRGSRLETASPT